MCGLFFSRNEINFIDYTSQYSGDIAPQIYKHICLASLQCFENEKD